MLVNISIIRLDQHVISVDLGSLSSSNENRQERYIIWTGSWIVDA